DGETLERAMAQLAPFGPRARFARADFREIPELLAGARADGILLDLGVSSVQLDTADRGFSFQADGPLDMRMDRTRGETAAEVVNRTRERDLADLIFRFGEEPGSRRIARAIARARERGPIRTTGELATVVRRAAPRRRPGPQRTTARGRPRGSSGAARSGSGMRIPGAGSMREESASFFLGKPIDNSQVVRQVDPRVSREIWFLLVLVALLVGGLVLYAWPALQIRNTGMTTVQLSREKERLLEENRKLRLEKATLENLKRVETIATRDLGLLPPTPESSVVVETQKPLPPGAQVASGK